ncbi:hypothetical protein WR25_13825 [Diploscapter pachys]|uniref:Uncharacterized protein n=1 Tax=Diploscapter pachys TaxID=2018661 RepID=A0A2A2JWE9_9BILA|nr:hypothetical protein WR25_13825 [Diploscapter pachys]
MNLDSKRPNKAYDEVFKCAFRRKRVEDSLFTNIVQIMCMDVDRSDSFQYHVYRLFILGLQISEELKNLGNVAAMTGSLIEVVARKDETWIVDRLHIPLLRFSLRVLCWMLSELERHKVLGARNELTRLWAVTVKNINPRNPEKLPLLFAYKTIQKVLTKSFGNPDALMRENQNEQKLLRKRRAGVVDTDELPSRPVQPVPQPQPQHRPATSSVQQRLPTPSPLNSTHNDFLTYLIALQHQMNASSSNS